MAIYMVELQYSDDCGHESEVIGLYSSRENAEIAIEAQCKCLESQEDYSYNELPSDACERRVVLKGGGYGDGDYCFYIHEVELDETIGEATDMMP